jgi:hypothetical protein
VTTITTRSNQTWLVQTLMGQDLELQHQSEQKFYAEAQRKYISENKFDVSSDLRALDRLVFLETLMHRWTSWLGSGSNYDGLLSPPEEEQLRKSIKETGPLISTIQNDLGLTKSQREKDQFESVGAYVQKLQLAAKAHGIRREKQLTKALDLINTLFSLVGTYRRSSENERQKLDIENAEQIVDWILNYMKPEYEEVDAYFREHEQKFWVGTL